MKYIILFTIILFGCSSYKTSNNFNFTSAQEYCTLEANKCFYDIGEKETCQIWHSKCIDRFAHEHNWK